MTEQQLIFIEFHAKRISETTELSFERVKEQMIALMSEPLSLQSAIGNMCEAMDTAKDATEEMTLVFHDSMDIQSIMKCEPKNRSYGNKYLKRKWR